MIDAIKIIIITNPILWTLVIAWVFGLIGMWIGAWWNSRPLSDLEQRVELHVRESDEHSQDYPENSKIKSPDDWPK